MIAFRVWYLAGLKHEEYLERALRPQRRTVVETAPRGTIRDRFNVPLAINKVQYNAAVCFDRIREIPVVSWERNSEGKKVKVYERKRYVERLSEMLGTALKMDPVEIEDLIYSKASIFPNTPFILKEDIDEPLYYRLKMLEREWTGLNMQRGAKRAYPQGKVASDVLGYMGAINERQYLAVAQEIDELTHFLEEREEGLPVPLPKGFSNAKEVEARLLDLREKAYTIHAHVGKTGIERKFDEELRGLVGKHEVELGAKGRFIRDLPGGRSPQPGGRILLSLSAELQAYAEDLLIENERDRERHFSIAGKDHNTVASPWIKGGAIVAMIPSTGEIVALASYPRFDPNDFHLTDRDRDEKLKKLYQWLESPRHIGALWDGKIARERELPTYTEKEFLSWETYLDEVLSKECQVRKSLSQVTTVQHAVHLQYVLGALKRLMGTQSMEHTLDELYPHVPSSPLIDEIRKELDPLLLPIQDNKDKLLFFDLLRLCVDGQLFNESSLKEGNLFSLSRYRELNQSFVQVKEEIYEQVKGLYQERVFPVWRKKHFKAFLKEKREEEKEKKTYPHPYTDYLAIAKKKLFQEFWHKHQWTFFEAFIDGKLSKNHQLQPFLFHLILKSKEVTGELQDALKKIRLSRISTNFMRSFASFNTLDSPLWGRYPSLKRQTLQGLASAFYPRNGYGYGKSFAYGRSTPIGSIFKVVTGYEALRQHYDKSHTLNPLELIDELNARIVTDQGIVLGKYLSGELITRHHKGGRLPRTHAPLGHVDFRTAMERSSNIYFSLLAGEVIDHPADLEKTTRHFGFGKPTEIDLYGETGGYVPDDLRDNKTGLYSFAIGQHSLVVTPLQTAAMLASIGNGGHLLKPQIIHLRANEKTVFPTTPETKRLLPMPAPVRTELMESLKRVVMGEKGPVQPYRIRALYEHPRWIPEYKAIQDQFVGKTSTAEFVYRPTLDREKGPLICKDIWFGALSFEEGDDYRIEMPDLCVVVYLKFGDYGKEAAPLAAQIIKKWREISSKSYN